MKVKQLFQKSGFISIGLFNPLVLGILPAIIIIISNPFQFEHYIFDPNPIREERIVFYTDLEKDGAHEKMVLGKEINNALYLLTYDDRDELLDQYNFNGTKAQTREPYIPYGCDMDGDKIKDLMIFTQRQDSLFLNVFSYNRKKLLKEDRFITKIGGYNEKLDFNIRNIGAFDVNKDGGKEFYFSVAGGFSLFPRRLFRYDLNNDSLICSINMGAAHLGGELFDNGDSALILSSGIAYGNVSSDFPYPYNDSCSWIFGFDENLQFIFDPIPYGGFSGSLMSFIPYENYFFSIHGIYNRTTHRNTLIKFNVKGEVLSEKHFDFQLHPLIAKINVNDHDQFFVINLTDDEIMEFIPDKMLIQKVRFNGKHRNLFIQIELTDNKKKELLTFDKNKNTYEILNHRFKKTGEFNFNEYYNHLSNHFDAAKASGTLFLVNAKGTTYLNYKINPYYMLKYPFWMLTYVVSVLFVAMIVFFQNKRNEKQQNTLNKITNLQLQVLSNQLDPHFTFNALNSVGNAIYKEDKKVAYDLFLGFTRMIRSSLIFSDKIFRSLKEELQFTKDYISFQQVRFPNLFEFQINMDGLVEQEKVEIPKLLLQGFVENAIKHAFYDIRYKGKISIEVKKKGNQIAITITDNGIGIHKSQKDGHTSGTKKGQSLFLEQIKHINKLYQTNLEIKISDLSDIIPNSHGTRVEVLI